MRLIVPSSKFFPPSHSLPLSFLLNSLPSSLQGHSDIESQGANHEQFRVILDRPKMNIWAVMSDDRFYTVYVEDASGLFNNNNMAVHGLIGKGEGVGNSRLK